MSTARMPMILLIIASIFITVLTVAVGAFAAVGLISRGAPTPIVPPSATVVMETPTSSPGSLGGRVWHDLCAVAGGENGAPLSPSLGCVQTGDGQYQGNGVLESGEPGLGGVLVQLGLGACPSTGLSAVLTSSDGSYLFSGLNPGAYCVSIDALGAGHQISLVPGVWTSPSVPAGTSLAGVTVSLAGGENRRDVNFGWDYQFLPEPPPATQPAPTATPGPQACTDRVTFVEDVSVPDNTNIAAGKSFEKIWRLRNSGTCTWTTSYALVFAGGTAMTNTGVVPLTGSLAPGATGDFKVVLTAPTAKGIYRSNWLLRNPAGVLFGLGDNGNQPFWAQIVVGPTGSTVNGAWKGEYFNNINLKGSPVVTRSDAVIDFDWAKGAPVAGVSADNFSVRWTGKADFDAGTYRFKVLVDDGARLWVDDVLVLNAWVDGSAREITSDVALTKGTHSLRLEYYDHLKNARVRLSWEKLSNPSFNDWKGEYFSNIDLSGTPALVRNDKEIDFAWGSGSPAFGLPNDNFSVRWTQKIDFPAGLYRFSARADDGIRVIIDGTKVIKEWHDSPGTTVYTVELQESGKHTIVVEYYEHGGKASVEFSWALVQNTPTPTQPGPTSTPTATEPPPTNTPTPTEPAPSPTPTATNTPEPVAIYRFAVEACEADWRNGAGDPLPCPGPRSTDDGFVIPLDGASLEGSNNTEARSLLMHPQSVVDGIIRGTYPSLMIQGGDRFRAILGCQSGQESCNVMLELGYFTDTDPTRRVLASWNEVFDGNLTTVNLELSSLAGEKVTFLLTVLANGAPDGDSVIWINPRIIR